MPDVVQAKPKENFDLELLFADGARGVVRVSDLIEFRGVFEKLKDPQFFRRVSVSPDLGTIVWENGADLDPQVLHSLVAGRPFLESDPRRDHNPLTVADRFFEDYLTSQQIGPWIRAPQFIGVRKRPDFVVETDLGFVIAEVKAPARRDAYSNASPYAQYRRLIDSARSQLVPFRGYPCVVVIANTEGSFLLSDPQFVYGAMLGDLGVQFSSGPGVSRTTLQLEPIFLQGGKLSEKRNTTISAVALLEHLKGQSAPRLIVHENPFARVKLPTLFHGLFDERFGVFEGDIRNVWVGLGNAPSAA
jgi:hypothetical protein